MIMPANQAFLGEFHQFVFGKGFLHIIHGAEFHRIDGGFDRRISGDHNDVRFRSVMLYTLHHVQAVHLRHFQIGEDEIILVLLHKTQRFKPVFDRVNRVACGHQDLSKAVEHDCFIVDCENSRQRVANLDPLERFRFK